MKEFLKAKKNKLAVVIMSIMAVMVSSVSAFAESSGTANSQVVTSMTGLANDMVATGTAIIPIALTVVGLTAVVVFGIKVFSRVSGNRAR